MTDFELIIRLANSFFTLGLGLLLLYLYLFKKVRFASLVAWSIAFIAYGGQILARIWYPWNSVEVFILSIAMSLPLVLGTSNLIKRNKIYGTVMLIAMAIAAYLFSSTGDWYKFGAFALYGIMTIAVIDLRLVIGSLANRLIVGWLILLVANILFVAVFPLEWVADLVAIPAKGILALGMFDQRLSPTVKGIEKISKAYQLATGKK